MVSLQDFHNIRLHLGSDMDDFIPGHSITPGKWVTVDHTGSYQNKGLYSINTSTQDEDSGLGMDIDQECHLATSQLGTPIRKKNMDDSLIEIRRPSDKCFQSFYTRRCLFDNKRALHLHEFFSSTSKRFRDESLSPLPSSLTISANLPPNSDPTIAITDAVDRMTFESDLIGDGSRTYSLPTMSGKNKDLRCISTDTMAGVLRGDYAGIDTNCTIIDCRYPYEFEGGHIACAVNFYTKQTMQQFLHHNFDKTYDRQRRILIFYCEFSSKRGPKMYRFLREQDRILNKDKYPHLRYPEVYLLEGGYKAFYENHKHYCEPMDYKPMLHKDHGAELRHFKTKSKSWAAGDKRQCHLRYKLVF